jgi:hypothetical protein
MCNNDEAIARLKTSLAISKTSVLENPLLTNNYGQKHP